MVGNPNTEIASDAPHGAQAPMELIAEFPRNCSDETIRVQRDAAGLIFIGAWNPRAQHYFGGTFVCNASHVSLLIDGLVKAMNPGGIH